MIRLALAQLNPTVGAIEANADRVLAACADAARVNADLVLAPELVIAGYPPEDLLFRPAFLAACRRAAERVAAETPVPLLLGVPWLDGDRVHDSAVLCAGGRIVARYDKRLLPNYGVFDEERTFSAGRRDLAFALGDAVCAVTVCEDIWVANGPANRAARGGATLILNLSASPYNVGKAREREQMLRTRVRDDVCAIAYCNLVGGQDELVFDGCSVVIGPSGDVIGRAAAFDEELLVCDVDEREALGVRLRDSRLRRGGKTPRLEVVTSLAVGRDREPLEPRRAAPAGRVEEELWAALRLGLTDYVGKNAFERVVLGLSGGIDSAIVAALAVDALGADRVEAISMPTRYNVAATRSDARRTAELLGIGFRELAIEELRETFAAALPEASGLAGENLQARIRGVILMTLSNQHGWLVLTTSNKSETAVGYSTLYGDTAGGFAPIKDVPKTMVVRLARYLNEVAGAERIPASVIDRPPTAELRDDQRDDHSLPPYELLDPILEAYVERDLAPAEIVALGIADAETVDRVTRMVDRAEYKRRQGPPGLKLHAKAFGRDRRVPITNHFS